VREKPRLGETPGFEEDRSFNFSTIFSNENTLT
jgi:hypothetical protein